MPTLVEITRTDHTPEELEKLGRDCKNQKHGRRLRAVAMILRGNRRKNVARAQGIDVQTLRDWVIRYNENGVDGLRDRPRGGSTCRLSPDQQSELVVIVEAQPDPQKNPLSRWRLKDLQTLILEKFGLSYSLEGVRRLLGRLGFRHISPRPIHPKENPEAQDVFRSTFSELAMSSVPEGQDPESVEIWFQDEARAGQKGMLTRIWARKGARPRIVRDHRYGYCYLFSAACPERKVGVGHICDRANTIEMNRHLAEISNTVQPGGHAVLVLDGAGWHRSKALEVPHNVSLLRLPPYNPELNSMENMFNYMKSNFLANRLFPTVDDVRDAVQRAWTTMIEQPDNITSIMSREWAVIKAKAA